LTNFGIKNINLFFVDKLVVREKIITVFRPLNKKRMTIKFKYL